jgi:DNA (cytosine-5)-methyltransferase 1
MSLRLGSLFSGIGGFDLAAQRVGMELAWQAEIELNACKVLAHRFPGVPNLGDVTTITDAPHVDVITFGSPCQDLSVAGKRAGMEGERSGLFFEAVRIIERVRPTFAVWENVPGALSSNQGRDFARCLDALADIGALDIAWRVLDARFFGVPQRRRRVFLVCDFAGERAAEILALTAGGAGDSPSRRAQGQDVATTLVGGSGAASSHRKRNGGDDGLPLVPDVAYCLAASVRGTGDGHGNAWNTTCALQLGNGSAGGPFHWNDIAPTLRGRDRDGYDVAVANCLTAPRTGGGGSYRLDDHEVGNLLAFHLTQDPISNRVSPALGQGNQAGCASIGVLAFDELNSAASDDIFGTLRGHGPAGHRCLAASAAGVRRLTPVECERLMALPDGWTCLEDHPQPCACSDGPRYRACGNAVVTNAAAWILGRIARLETP